jgi:hypothetical protein
MLVPIHFKYNLFNYIIDHYPLVKLAKTSMLLGIGMDCDKYRKTRNINGIN